MKKQFNHKRKILLLIFSLTGVLIFSFYISSLMISNERKKNINSLEQSEINWLKENYDTISIAIDPINPPVSYIDENGNFNGAVEDYLKLLESRLNIKFNRVSSSNWKEALDLAISGSVDIVAPTAWTKERAELLLFTQPFISLNTVFITVKDRTEITGIESLKNKGLAVIDYSALLEYLKSNESQLNIIPVNNDLEGLKKLITGEFDALAADLPTVPYYIKQTGLSNLRIAGETGFYYNYSLATSRLKPLLSSSLSKALYSITPEENDLINSKWELNDSSKSLSNRKLLIAVLLPVIITAILTILFFIWNKILRKKVEERTEELSSYKEELEKTVVERTEELNSTIIKLQQILEDLKTLRGLIPICANCRKIRDDEGYWHQMEIYIREHSKAEFSHSLCPDCATELYGDSRWFNKNHDK